MRSAAIGLAALAAVTGALVQWYELGGRLAQLLKGAWLFGPGVPPLSAGTRALGLFTLASLAVVAAGLAAARAATAGSVVRRAGLLAAGSAGLGLVLWVGLLLSPWVMLVDR